MSEACYVSVDIYNSSNVRVKTLAENKLFETLTNSFIWDGTSSSGTTVVQAGKYTYKVLLRDKAGNKLVNPAQGTVTVK